MLFSCPSLSVSYSCQIGGFATGFCSQIHKILTFQNKRFNKDKSTEYLNQESVIGTLITVFHPHFLLHYSKNWNLKTRRCGESERMWHDLSPDCHTVKPNVD